MRILTNAQAIKEHPFDGKKYAIATEIEKKLYEQYSAGRGEIIVHHKLYGILAVVGADLVNRKILDLGCGAAKSVDCNGTRDFEPWVCRGLVELGTNPIGIDIFDNSKEKFENYQTDLTTPNSLNFIPDNSIDIAHSWGLFDSPFLRISVGKGRKEDNLLEILLPQLERIVKPEGIFICGY